MQLPMKQIALSLFVIAASGAYVWDQAGRGPADGMLGSALPADATEESSLRPAVSAVAAPAPAIISPEIRQQTAHAETRVRTGFLIDKGTTAAIAAPSGKSALPVKPPQVSQVLASPPQEPPSAPAVAEPAPSTQSFAITPAAYIPIPRPRPAYPDAPARVIRAGMKLAAHGYADGVYTGPAADAYYGIIQLQALVQNGRLTALKILQYPSDRRTSIRINRQALPMLRDEAISAQSADVDIITGATLTSKAFVQSLRGALKQAS
jgi:uncharacterized protein with FMN-binding domain